MNYLVFAQTEDDALPAARLVAQARAHFPALGLTIAPGPHGERLIVARPEPLAADVEVRRATPHDREQARAAEIRGQATGMGDLAARCPTVWTFAPEEPASEWLVLEVVALLAFVALGPVLPPDGATLLGVRSARTRSLELRKNG